MTEKEALEAPEQNSSNATENTAAEASPDNGEALALSKDQVRIAAWLRFMLVWLFCLVVVGGLVRLTHSGMSIPDWPVIYYGPEQTKPSILPPFSEASWQQAYNTYYQEVVLRPNSEYGERSMGQFKREFWTEWGHRGLAKGFAILYLAVLIQTWRKKALRERIFGLLLTAGLILFFQIVLGGVVVRKHTPALYVSFHLTTAFIFVAMVAWSALKIARPYEAPKPPKAPALTKLAWAVAIICLVQVFSGGIVANTKAGLHYNTWPAIGETIIPPLSVLWSDIYEPVIRNFVDNIVLVQFIHRWLAFGVAAMVFVLAGVLFMKPLSTPGRWAVRAVVFTVGFQILLGIYTLLEGIPVVPAALHLGTGLVLFVLLISLVFEVRHNNAIYALELEKEAKLQKELEAQLAA